MIKEAVTIQDAIDLLNDLLKLDYDCISRLITTRLYCNDQIVNHPTVTVYSEASGSASLGLMGMINGLFGTNENGAGPICFEIGEDGKISNFKKTPVKKD